MNLSLLRLRTGVAFLGALGTGTLAAQTPVTGTPIRTLSAPALTPDGQQIVFAWAGDLWSASADGGLAKRLTQTPARESRPLVSADGKSLVYNRESNGAAQVFIRPLAGGDAQQLTFHSEGCTLEALTDPNKAIVSGPRDRGDTQPERLLEIDLKKPQREQMLFDAAAHDAAVSADGKRVLFCTDGEPWFRKGYRGARASKLWSFANNAFEPLVNESAAATSPIPAPDGKTFYYVSERNGTANLWSQEFGAKEGKALTFFQDDGVRAPALSTDGSTFVFLRGLQVYRFRPGKDEKPVALDFWHEEKHTAKPASATFSNSTDFSFTPALDAVVFSAGGELWFQPVKGGAATRLTDTDEQESSVVFSADGKWLYYLVDDGLQANYWRLRLKDGGAWTQPESFEAYQITIGQSSKCHLAPSPDGKRIAWIEGNGDLHVADADGGSAKKLFASWSQPTFAWSPDSSVIAFSAQHGESNRDLWIAKADGSQAAVNITRDPATEFAPAWSPDGKHLAFSLQADGARPPMLHVLALDPAAYSRGYTADEANGIARHAQPLEMPVPQDTVPVWTADSANVIFSNGSNKADAQLQGAALDTFTPRVIAKFKGTPLKYQGDTLLAEVDGAPALWQNQKLTRLPIKVEVAADEVSDRRFAFRSIWRTLRDRFYDPVLNRRDWNAVRLKYEEAAVTAVDDGAFATVVQLLLGELNASHLSFKPEQAVEKISPTGHLGLRFRNGDAEAPLVIESVIGGSPAALLPNPPRPGDTVVRIGALKPNAATSLHSVLNGNIDQKVSLTIANASGKERTIEVRPISYFKARQLDQADNAAAIRSMLTAANGPRLGYLSLRHLDDASLDVLERELYNAEPDTDALILDLRDNSGGRLADRLLSAFQPIRHAFTLPRGGSIGYPQNRLPSAVWTKPFIVLCNQHTVSNAEIFAHAIRMNGNIPVVGAPTAGAVATSMRLEIPHAGTLQFPFRAWFSANSGDDLEMNPVQPSATVWNTPADEASGNDPQLDTAARMLRMFVEQQAPQKPLKFRSER